MRISALYAVNTEWEFYKTQTTFLAIVAAQFGWSKLLSQYSAIQIRLGNWCAQQDRNTAIIFEEQ